jgi:hypothetical protein
MKTVFTFLCLALIVIVCATSAILYLETYYNSSALLTIIWIVSIAYWIKANGFLNEPKTGNAE